MIVNEVYFGKVQEIEDIFTEFKRLRHDYSMLKTWSNSKQTAKIEKMIENFFGFRAFTLEISLDSIPNAYTYPVSTCIDIDPTDFIETTSKGYKYKKNARAAAQSIITSGLFKNKALTDEECFAIFLHEIGHSFVHRSPMIAAQQDVYKSALIINIIMNVIISILTLNPMGIVDAAGQFFQSNSFFKLVDTKITQIVKKTPLLRDIKFVAGISFDILKNTLVRTINTLVTVTGIGLLNAKLNKWQYDSVISNQEKITGKQNAYGRSMERLSDDFATMYGFGPALSTGLVKIENYKNQGLYMKAMNDLPLIGKLTKKTDAIAMELNGLIGVHPASSDRILSILEAMKKDIDIDKKMPEKIKVELRANIKEQERIIKEIKNEQNEALKNKNQFLQAITVLGLKDGSTEDFLEKKYTDRKKLKLFYDSRKERKIRESVSDLDLDMDLPLQGDLYN